MVTRPGQELPGSELASEGKLSGVKGGGRKPVEFFVEGDQIKEKLNIIPLLLISILSKI